MDIALWDLLVRSRTRSSGDWYTCSPTCHSEPLSRDRHEPGLERCRATDRHGARSLSGRRVRTFGFRRGATGRRPPDGRARIGRHSGDGRQPQSANCLATRLPTSARGCEHATFAPPGSPGSGADDGRLTHRSCGLVAGVQSRAVVTGGTPPPVRPDPGGSISTTSLHRHADSTRLSTANRRLLPRRSTH